MLNKYLKFTTPYSGQYFFGYYDKSPFDKDDQKLLAMKAEFIDCMPDKNDILEIGYFNWKNHNTFKKIAETRAWNWQQGCMLQWVGPDFKSHIIYNDRQNNKFVSVLLNVETGEKIELPMSIYSMHPNGKHAVCIDNERHFWFRGGYSYQGIEHQGKNIKLDKNDGIWLLDIEEKNIRQIINIIDLIKYRYLSSMEGAIHYIEHLMFSPDGERFSFLHRWTIDDGGIYARFFTADMDGSNIFLLNDTGRMSHSCWRNNNELMAWCGLPTPVNQLRKYKYIVKYAIKPLLPVYNKLLFKKSVLRNTFSGDSYVLFKDKSSEHKRIAQNILNKDGHMSFCPINTDWFVSDTYPDVNNFSSLFLYNIQEQKFETIARVESDPAINSTPFRCDLHPKWSFSGRYVCIDTVNEGIRQMYVYDLEKIFKDVK